MLQILRNSLVRRKFVGLKNGSKTCSNAYYSTRTGLKEEDAEEVRIPVPWGHIAGKWWRRSDEIPILAIHGWQDNAGSYDKLIPLLNVSNLLAIDLPGHGLSSHIPPGKVYTFLDYIYNIRRVIDHFKWEKYSIIGHSLGSALGHAYTAIHKDEVQCLISLECARYLLLAYTTEFPMVLNKGLEKILQYDDIKNDTAPGYKYSQAISGLIAGSFGSVTTAESASVLLRRGATKRKASELVEKKDFNRKHLQVFYEHEISLGSNEMKSEINKKMEDFQKSVEEMVKGEMSEKTNEDDCLYKFTKDPRIKMIQFGVFPMEIWQELLQNITCPVLSLQADEGFMIFSSEELYKQGNEILKKQSKHFEHHIVKGNHHVHLNNPENVAPVINNFLQKVK